MKPIRTALSVPGNRPERIEKAITSDADVVRIDLEASIPIAEKEKSRLLVREILDKYPGERMYVRVNALSTPYGKEDLEAVVSKNLKGIVFPKVESPDDIFQIDRLLSDLEAKAKLAVGIIKVLPICETANGLENIYDIVSARPEHHRLLTMIFGAVDYTLDLGIDLTREGKELEYPRSRLPVACRAGGIMPPLGTPWIHVNDIDGLIADAKKDKAYGFMGKMVIHPSQIQPCHDIFTPSTEEIEYAKKVIAAFEEAEREGKTIQLDGNFIGLPVVEKYRQIVELAKLLQVIND